MELSERDRRELAAIERMMTGQDPDLARRLSTGLPERGRAALPIAHIAALVLVLASLCLVHAAVPDLHWILSAVLTTALVVTWLLVTSGALPVWPSAPARRSGGVSPRRDGIDG